MPKDHDTSGSSLFGRLSARSSFISSKIVKVTVQLLHDSDTVTNEFKRTQTVQEVLDYICEVKQIHEKDYLGLRYFDHSTKHRYWVDLTRPISHFLKTSKIDSLSLCLRFRFYPTEPSHLRESISRYQLFVQLQRDLLHGRLYCPQLQSAELAALILQAQLGDFDAERDVGNYVSLYTLLLRQTPKQEERIAEIHKTLSGTLRTEAELQFLEMASKLDTYGFDPYTLKDSKLSSDDVFLGVNHRGILVFHAHRKTQDIPWSQLVKVDYIGRELRVVTSDSYQPPAVSVTDTCPGEKDKKQRLVLRYHCSNGQFAKHLWTHILSQQAFFTEDRAQEIKPKFSKPRIPLFSRGSTFRFGSRRVLREIEAAPVPSGNNDTLSDEEVERYPLPRASPREEQPWLNKFHTLPRSGKNNNNNNNDVTKAHPVHNGVSNHPSAIQSPSSMEFNQTSPIESSHVSESFSSPECLNSLAMTPSSSSPTSPNNKDNVTSFTVHLIKYERSPAPSPSPPCEREEEAKTELVTENESTFPSPLLTSTPNDRLTTSKILKNGHANGEAVGECSNSGTSSPGKTGRVANCLFFSIVLFILLFAIVIALFERQDSGGDWLSERPWFELVRREYYEPAREFTLINYRKLLRK